MDMTTMSTGMMIACVLFGILLITFLVVGIAAGIKYLRSPQEARVVPDEHHRPLADRRAA